MISVPAFDLLYMIWLIILIATHISLTILVYKDAQTLTHSDLRITPVLWAGVSFSIPVVGMFIYWIINYSTLNKVNYIKIHKTDNVKNDFH